MAEQRDQSDGSVSLSPPLLQLQAAPQSNTNTNFFIDNILRPDFGCRRQRGPGAHPSDRGVLALVVRPPLPSTPCPDSSCSTDSVSSASSTVSSPASQRHCRVDEPTGVNARKCGVGPGETSAPCKDTRQLLWPAWVYCTRYSDRPSSGPRTRKLKKQKSSGEDKRARTAFTGEQLQRLKAEFHTSRYISEPRRQLLAQQLKLNEAQIKIWFQNKRAKLKKASGLKNGLALQLMAQGLYNHSTSSTVQEEEKR